MERLWDTSACVRRGMMTACCELHFSKFRAAHVLRKRIIIGTSLIRAISYDFRETEAPFG